jgi:hypothetical protein
MLAHGPAKATAAAATATASTLTSAPSSPTAAEVEETVWQCAWVALAGVIAPRDCQPRS